MSNLVWSFVLSVWMVVLGHNKCTTPECFSYTFEIWKHSLQNIQMPHIIHVWIMCGAYNLQHVLCHGPSTEQCICERFRQLRSTQIVNTFFEKRPNHVVTCKSGGRQRQIVFLMCRRQQMDEVNNCKAINGKSVAAKHRVLVLDLEFKCLKRRMPEQMTPKINWGRLK